MCGICGFAGPGDATALAAMNGRLARRGPDGEGVFADAPAGVFLAHRRLAIIDLAGGRQPMATPDGSLAVTYNGEIYNHAALRRELTAKGHHFATGHSDTEVLLHGWREWGETLPEHLNGMWAFALYDKARGQLFCSRDRFGKKPFFYAARPGFFAFASELSSLIAHPALAGLSVSRPVLRKYFAYGFIPGPNALYAGTAKLPGGENLLVDVGTLSVVRRTWWSFCIEPMEAVPADPEREWGGRLLELLDAAVARRLMADVPLGVFLSGGVDSSAITALAVRHAPDIAAFSIGFDDPDFDESAKARRAAAFCRVTHHEARFSLETALSLMPEILGRLDEPMGDVSLVPTALLCRETRKHVTVALGGDGADELFAGYDPFRAIRAAECYARLAPKPLHRALTLLAARLPVGHGYMHASFKVNRFLRGLSFPPRLWNPTWLGPLAPDEIAGLFEETVDAEDLYSEAIGVFEACPSRSLVDKTMEFYTRLYLQDDILVKTDRAGMMHSLEVRAPFLDIELVDFVRTMPHAWKFRRGTTKYILKKALEAVLPRDIIYRRKQGFGVPVGRWLADGALPMGAPSPLETGLSTAFIDSRIREHRSGAADHRLFLWNLWVLRRMAGGGV
ncbi:asparagine synthase (glutamine-hydrolyzing) [Solidesulfovibrio carbinoliphilus subsp. oakridgensis]|uniref:asparagine synthase (glutamine-hydrolyzing) n=1 Tax=Solidesulfovibrio carbinoliphilus subsp. oakridgensis TaxID=694327 RepID=G7Q891_9BACT|nr:asparagine synthase (glutamine-hydrolyzing) [Solidesulfovibrio carbinoliphilus]EHJ48105.1 asparagine synthase (glutamine-hydrolyzing) [Solidesulfovibrio carbinoliphilus subsp. oakridgensis]